MSGNPKRTAKSKSQRSGKSAVDKAKKKTRKRKKKLSPEEINARAKAAFTEVDEQKDAPKSTTMLMPIELLTHEEIEQITRENSFMLNPVLANASLQKDLATASNRLTQLQELHDHLFDVQTLSEMDDKTKVALYSIAIQDHHKTIQAKIKISELSDKNRILREVQKIYSELEKQQEISNTDTSHTSEIIKALLNESMRHALEDEMQKKTKGSNSYRPEEDKGFKILSIDANADS